MLSGKSLSHQSKLQNIIAFLSTEAKYIAFTKPEKKAL